MKSEIFGLRLNKNMHLIDKNRGKKQMIAA